MSIDGATSGGGNSGLLSEHSREHSSPPSYRVLVSQILSSRSVWEEWPLLKEKHQAGAQKWGNDPVRDVRPKRELCGIWEQRWGMNGWVQVWVGAKKWMVTGGHREWDEKTESKGDIKVKPQQVPHIRNSIFFSLGKEVPPPPKTNYSGKRGKAWHTIKREKWL